MFTLDQYMTEKTIANKAAGAELDADQETVRNWRNGTKVPRPDKIRLIYIWSDGMVDANSFYNLPNLAALRAARAKPAEAIPGQLSLLDACSAAAGKACA